MSIQNRSNTESYVANVDLSSSQYYGVKLDAQGDGVGLAGAGEWGGFLQNQPEQYATAEVAMQPGQNSYAIIADSSASVGDQMKFDASGMLTVTTTISDLVVARMLIATSTSGEIGVVKILDQKL